MPLPRDLHFPPWWGETEKLTNFFPSWGRGWGENILPHGGEAGGKIQNLSPHGGGKMPAAGGFFYNSGTVSNDFHLEKYISDAQTAKILRLRRAE